MKFIKNTSDESHQEVIRSLIKESDTIKIAVAFLKQSGLNLLLPIIKQRLHDKVGMQIIIGQHFALTDPSALWSLFHLMRLNDNLHVRLAKLDTADVFHPKIYLFKNGSDGSSIIGSANLTLGGLANNFECSTLTTSSTTDAFWIDVQDYFEQLFTTHSVELTRFEILKYEAFHAENKEKLKRVKSNPKRTKTQQGFSYESLRRHFGKYDNKRRQNRYEGLKSNYRAARKVLEKLASKDVKDKNSFISHFDSLITGPHYWSSGNMQRNKTDIYENWKSFQKLVRFVQANSTRDAEFLFQKGKVLLNDIRGAGINYLTEILMTFDPKRFANMNKNPLTVLTEEAGLNIHKHSSSYNGESYQDYCELIKEISSQLGIKDMIEADNFFNDIYWPLKRKLSK